MKIGEVESSCNWSSGGRKVRSKCFLQILVGESLESLFVERHETPSRNCFGCEVYFCPGCSVDRRPCFNCRKKKAHIHIHEYSSNLSGELNNDAYTVVPDVVGSGFGLSTPGVELVKNGIHGGGSLNRSILEVRIMVGLDVFLISSSP